MQDIIKLIKEDNLENLKKILSEISEISINNEFIKGYAVQFGKLEILKYLHENGYPWHKSGSETLNACLYGHIDCLRYSHENGSNWHIDSTLQAARTGNLDCLKYAHEIKAYWHPDTSLAACKNGNIECLNFIEQVYKPLSVEDKFVLYRKKHLESLTNDDKELIEVYRCNFIYKAVNYNIFPEDDIWGDYWKEIIYNYCTLTKNSFNPYSYTDKSDFWNLISDIKVHLSKIIENSPPLLEDITVFVGTSTINDEIIDDKRFITSYLIETNAQCFSCGHIIKMVLKKGTKCLLGTTMLFEVILPQNLKFKIVNKYFKDDKYNRKLTYYDVEIL